MGGCLGKRREGGRGKGWREEGGGREEGTNKALMVELSSQDFGKLGGKMGREYWGPAGHLLISRKKKGLTC